jgi:hypothetical protein
LTTFIDHRHFQPRLLIVDRRLSSSLASPNLLPGRHSQTFPTIHFQHSTFEIKKASQTPPGEVTSQQPSRCHNGRVATALKPRPRPKPRPRQRISITDQSPKKVLDDTSPACSYRTQAKTERPGGWVPPKNGEASQRFTSLTVNLEPHHSLVKEQSRSAIAR